jgi:hypothetical protein
MKTFGGWIALAMISAGALLYSAPPAKAADMGWPITNRSPYAIEIQFYSRSRNAVWPPRGQVWVVQPYGNISPVLRCSDGEYICYGAWPRGSGTLFWGVGRGGAQGCSSCCFVCRPGYVGGHTLN